MKIQCDVCGKEAAVVFCTADEAALCQNCDDRVHNANKLASKHPRFSLLSPQLKESSNCDICQVKRHNRFLLNGVKLSAYASSYELTASSSGSQSEMKIHSSVAKEVNCQSNSGTNWSDSSPNPLRDNRSNVSLGEQSSDSTSSISEYLMETLPGWHVDDILDPSPHNGFCKIDEHESPSNEESRCTTDFFIQRHAYMFSLYTSSDSNSSYGRKKWCKDGFAVPQNQL